ncbi:SMF protein [uncultured Alphaproteobacteria bacterium]|uniref:SMF protein n=1 Tax=uncultured Alphaproteobacteria bacterium TaxID=91750 RepID=A0A212JAD7_9PROT|nr:SMF protein [uncultured Alphaproteobacteria bacterium]
MHADLSDEDRIDWLRLSRSENVGPVAFRRLLGRFGSASAALAALPDLARSGGLRRPIAVAPHAAAEAELAALDRLGGRLLALPDADYPAPLREISDAPPVLCALGRGELLRRDAVAIVGARNASVHGGRFAQRLAADLAASGLVVVSGFARGIDAAAHAGAGAANTVAVMAGGADVIYPRENRKLWEAIRAEGCIVSEMPPGTEPQARHFPRRNRIVSGLARGVVVVEATPRSGSLITARLAGEQGREVMAVPGFPADPRSGGTNALIKDGATLVETADDVIAAIAPQRIPVQGSLPGFADADAAFIPARLASAPDSAAERRERLLESLTSAPLPVDVALRECQLSAAEGAIALLELELAGRIERLAGQMIARIPG